MIRRRTWSAPMGSRAEKRLGESGVFFLGLSGLPNLILGIDRIRLPKNQRPGYPSSTMPQTALTRMAMMRRCVCRSAVNSTKAPTVNAEMGGDAPRTKDGVDGPLAINGILLRIVPPIMLPHTAPRRHLQGSHTAKTCKLMRFSHHLTMRGRERHLPSTRTT